MKIGELLKNKRIEKKLTLEQVYYATRIPPQVLSALEEEKFDILAGKVYVKSFLKKYAEFLGIDSNEIAKAYLSTLSEPTPSLSVGSLPKERVEQRRIFKRIVLSLILILIIFILLNFLFHSFKKFSTKRREKKTFKPVPQETFFVPLKEDLILKIKAKKDTWIQIKADGKVVFQHILKAGTEDSWKAKENFELWVGEVKNITLSLNEKPLEIKGEGIQKGIIIDHRGIRKE